MKNKHIGSTLDSFFEEDGIKEDVDLRAKKKILADEMLAKMQRDKVTRTDLARRMKTSRTVVNRLLDPSDTSFTFATLAKASDALDLTLLISLAEGRHDRAGRSRRLGALSPPRRERATAARKQPPLSVERRAVSASPRLSARTPRRPVSPRAAGRS